ncbi:8067_t:CDS:2, partial [Racocetra persica]
YFKSEPQEPHIHPSFSAESKWTLSEEMKQFSEITYTKRIELIKAKLINKTALDIWHPITITCEEAIFKRLKVILIVRVSGACR